MTNSCLRRALFGCRAAAWRVPVLAVLGVITISAQASAQWWPWGHRPDPWVLALDGGGSYSVSDLEIVPSTDQSYTATYAASSAPPPLAFVQVDSATPHTAPT